MSTTPDTLYIDCHAHGIYPYVGCNELMTLLLPRIVHERPELVREFARTIITLAPDSHAMVLRAAPDLAGFLGEPGETPFTANGLDEGLHHRDRPKWLAHAMVEFLCRWWDGTSAAAVPTLVFTNVDHADPLQNEFLEILARRIRPQQARLLLRRRGPRPAPTPRTPDGHGVRAAELVRQGGRSLQLTLVPYHLERSSAAPSRIVEALAEAAEHYLTVGFYDIALRSAAAALRHSEEDGLVEGRMNRAVILSQMMMGRPAEAEATCADLQRHSTNPVTLLYCTNVRALLHARVHAPDARDYAFGLEQIEECLRQFRNAPESIHPVPNMIFIDRNLRALFELRTGGPKQAMRLLLMGLDELRRDCPEMYETESLVYFQNIGRLYYRGGKHDLAVEAFTKALDRNPMDAEIYVERGDSRRAAGEHQEAVLDYRLAVVSGPAHPRIHFNAGLSYTAMGRSEDAVGEYGKALVLDPDHVDSLLNRGNLLHAMGRFGEARNDVEHGLTLAPEHPGLLCTLGLLELGSGNHWAALSAFNSALAAQPKLVQALINRGTTWFDLGHPRQALNDFTRALAVRPDATSYFNRGLVHQSLGHWHKALDDYDKAMQFDDADTAALTRWRDDCAHLAAGDQPQLDLTPSPGGGPEVTV